MPIKPSERALILTVEPFPSALISTPLLVSATCKAFLPADVGAGRVVPMPTSPAFVILKDLPPPAVAV